MIFLEEYCTITLLDQNLLLTCKPFDCGDSDLNYFSVRMLYLIQESCWVKHTAIYWIGILL